jgi:hypothetical protein
VWACTSACTPAEVSAWTCTSGAVAALAADVLSNPPPEIAAAQRFLGAIGAQHEGAAALVLLRVLMGCQPIQAGA